MDNNEFLKNLITYKFVEPIWEYLSKVILKPLVDDELLKIFSLYFAFISSGSSCMPLDKELLLHEWKLKCEGNIILVSSGIENEDEKNIIEKDILNLYECGKQALNNIDRLETLTNVIGKNKLFIIDNNFLFARKYYDAKEGIKASIKRLFINYKDQINYNFDVKGIWKTASLEQESFIKNGIFKNLVLCGGPGTGKTTAVFYLLLALLKAHSDYKIYLTAPSGKAASRIKESIDGEIEGFIKNNPNNHEYDIEINKLFNVNKYTIHKLLEIDYFVNGFKYNENNQFDVNSIFIIDESSMIDVCIFDALLKAIPDGARVFILGDKHQLPSVECGAVLADLLAYPKLKDNIVELTKSHRFVEGSDVYKLSLDVNLGNKLENIFFKSFDDFKIINRLTPKPNETKEERFIRQQNSYPVFYYEEKENTIKTFENIIEDWGLHFYANNEALCTNVLFNEEELDKVYKNIDEARVLCAENQGKIGVNTINNIIKNKVIKSSKSLTKGFYPGIPLMITENNKALDLDNGDTGIVVSIENSDTLYFLIAKSSNLYPYDSLEVEDKILKLGKYLLYPLSMLDLKKIIYAYAITIHKSQGSGYNNILVVLPKKSGHPLLNRQIIYTGITRTKGPTYIVSNNERMNEAINNISYRYTRIFD